MDQAVRAPAIMQELISGTDTGAVPASTPRYQPGTIREIIEEETPARPRPVIEMSDDEMAEEVPAASHSADSVDAMMELSGGSEEAEASSGATGATGRRGRRKKVPADLTFSSGRNPVGHWTIGGQFSYSQVESPTTQSSSQSL